MGKFLLTALNNLSCSSWSTSSDLLHVLMLCFDRCQVKAIRVDESCKLEAEAQALLRQHIKKPLDEEVFIAQLRLRAQLLDSLFRDQVEEVVRTHAATDGRLYMNSRPIRSDPSSFMDGLDSSAELAQAVTINCSFAEGSSAVEIHAAPIKTVARIREKLLEYGASGSSGKWPFTASVLDPIRVSVVCEGASQMLQVMRWFTLASNDTGLPVCRIKNKFVRDETSVVGNTGNGYRDLQLSVLVTGHGGLCIIGEIQVFILHFLNKETISCSQNL